MKLKLKDIPVLYINLDRDVDKNIQMQKMLKKLGFKNTTRIPGELIENDDHNCFLVHPEWNPCGYLKYKGCSLAHIKALTYANTNYPDMPVIILEDDCILINKIKSIDLPDDADALYIGIGNGGMSGINLDDIDNSRLRWKNSNPEFILGKTISRILNMGSAHAILYMNNKYRSEVIKACNIAIKKYTLSDIVITAIQKDNNIYGLNKPIFAQSGVFLEQTDTTLDIIDNDIKLGININV